MSLLYAILEITDGTDTVNLISLNRGNDSGFGLSDWTPKQCEIKGGGTYQESPLVEGRRLIGYQWSNATETFELKVSEFDMDGTARDVQNLKRLLEKARLYWTTNWQTTPVYLKVRGSKETNTRYALIVNYSTPQEDNPFRQPLHNCPTSVMDDFQLIIERGHWSANVPRAATAVGIYSSPGYGTTPLSTGGEIFVDNHHTLNALTHIYVDDGGVFGANLLAGALPYKLLPNVPAANDAVYFGIQSGGANTGQFSSLIFNLSIAGAGYNGTWEYWNGAWVALSPYDGTGQFKIGVGPGMGSYPLALILSVQSDWATTVVNGITAYWVRMRVTSITAPTPPTQATRHVYTCTTPYVDISSTQVLGDIEALGRIILGNPYKLVSNNFHIYTSIRSLDRGSNFTPFLKASDKTSHASISFSEVGATTSIVDYSVPTGRCLLHNPAGVEAIAEVAGWTLDSTIDPEYIGRYRAFLRCKQVGGTAGDFSAQIKLSSQATATNIIFQSEIIYTTVVGDWMLLDLGALDYEASDYIGGDIGGFNESFYPHYIGLWLGNSNGAPGDLYVYDLVLFPADEVYFDIFDIRNYASVYAGEQIIFDSIGAPKKTFRSVVSNYPNAQIESVFGYHGNGTLTLRNNEAQRIWFLFATNETYGDVFAFEDIAKVKVEKSERYLGMRGTR